MTTAILTRRFFRLFAIWLTGLLFLNLTSAFCHARTLKIGIYQNKPLVFYKDSTQVNGLAIDVLRHVAQREGWTLEFVPGSWTECLQRLEQGQIDLQVAIAVSDQRKKLYSYPNQTLITNWGRLYSHPDARIESLLDLNGTNVAMLEQDIHARVFKSLTDKFNLKFRPIFVQSYDEVLETVQKNKASVGLVNRMYAMQNAQRYKVKTTPMIFNPIEVRYAAPKNSDGTVLDALDHHISALRDNKNSIYYQSLESWFGKEETATLPTWLMTALILSFAAAAVILAITLFLKKQVALKTAEIGRVNTQLKNQIGQLKQAQMALEESEKKYRTVLDHQQDALLLHKYMADDYAHFSDVNDTAVKFYGYTRYELLNLNAYSIVAPELMEQRVIDKRKEQLVTRGHLVNESVHIKKSGERVPVEVSMSMVELEGELYILAVVRDISERKEAEKERCRLEDQIRQKFKMEAVGAMAGGIAHNFNNSLAMILGNLEMAQRRSGAPEKVGRYLNNAQKAVLLARGLVQQILIYSRKGSHEKTPVQLSKMVNDILNLLRSTIPSSIELKFECKDQQLSTILADPNQIHEILLNLCVNAVHAMNEKGVMKISVETFALDQADIPAQYECREGNYARLSVQDSGCGMPKEILDKIFDPFFTTKKVNEGTGMGLSTVQGIVEQHHGFIRVQSQPGQGTTFELFFPVVNSEAPKVSDSEDNSAQFGAGHILFVDDEKMLLDLGEQILSALGYQVTTEINSGEALERFRQNPDRFDLLITDQTMPNLSGKELSQEIHKLNPDLPIILCTGYSSQISEEDAGDYGISTYCTKPLKVSELSKLVKDVLKDKLKRAV